MCGIVGFISRKDLGSTNSCNRAFSELLVIDTLRGFDSTGFVYKADDDKGVKVVKHVGTAAQVLDMYKDRMNVVGPARFAIGHNRAATVGGVNEELAHPFEMGDVVGVHNGTISNWRSLFDSTQSSDSQAFYSSLSKLPADDESVIKLLSTIMTGAYAFVWYDGRSEEVRFARNNDRPLYFLNSDEGLLWASEKRMLEFIVNSPSRPLVVPKSEIFQLDTHKLVSIPIGRADAEARVAEYKPTWPKYTPAHGQGYLGYSGGRQWFDDGTYYDAEFWQDRYHDSYPNRRNNSYTKTSGSPYVVATRLIMSQYDLSDLERSIGKKTATIMNRVIEHDFGIDCSSSSSATMSISEQLRKWLVARQKWSKIKDPVMTIVGVERVNQKTVVHGFYELDDCADPIPANFTLWQTEAERELVDTIQAYLDEDKAPMFVVHPKGFMFYCTGDYAIAGSGVVVREWSWSMFPASSYDSLCVEAICANLTMADRDWEAAWENVRQIYVEMAENE